MKFVDLQHDPWRVADGLDDALPAAHRLLTPAQWQTWRDAWPVDMPVGLHLPNDADVEALEPGLPRLALIALQFPRWTDGRAYTQAHLLRARLGYRGEVRATGEVLVDMLPLLRRTGFDAVQLRPDQSLEAAPRALRFFASHDHGDAHETRPLWRRHAKTPTHHPVA